MLAEMAVPVAVAPLYHANVLPVVEPAAKLEPTLAETEPLVVRQLVRSATCV